jgi:hypothetical protein
MIEELGIAEARIEWLAECEPKLTKDQKADVFALSVQLKYNNYIAEDYEKVELKKENRRADCLTMLNGHLLCEPNLRKPSFDPSHDYVPDVIKQIKDMMDNTKLSVDEHHSDQLLAFMGLAEGTSRIRTIKPLSLHCQTMVELMPMYHPGIKFKVTEEESTCLIEVEGIGLKME